MAFHWSLLVSPPPRLRPAPSPALANAGRASVFAFPHRAEALVLCLASPRPTPGFSVSTPPPPAGHKVRHVKPACLCSAAAAAAAAVPGCDHLCTMSSTIISTLTCGVALVALTGAAAMPADEHRAVTRSGTATVTMSTASGKPAYLVAGVHNGIPPNSFSSYVAGTPAATAAVQTQIPNSMFTGIKLQNARGGQSNLPDPSQGWLYGLVQYQACSYPFE